MKYILLLSFLLALLPGQNTSRPSIVKSPDFIVTLDQLQSLPSSESGKKPALDGEEPHHASSHEFCIYACNTSFYFPSYSALFHTPTTPYSIRAPPTIAAA